jgi:N-glycosylase/DNA lyase
MLRQESAVSTNATKLSRALPIVYVHRVPHLLCKLRLSMECNEHSKAIAFSNKMLRFLGDKVRNRWKLIILNVPSESLENGTGISRKRILRFEGSHAVERMN